jgi:hypothetical protein
MMAARWHEYERPATKDHLPIEFSFEAVLLAADYTETLNGNPKVKLTFLGFKAPMNVFADDLRALPWHEWRGCWVACEATDLHSSYGEWYSRLDAASQGARVWQPSEQTICGRPTKAGHRCRSRVRGGMPACSTHLPEDVYRLLQEPGFPTALAYARRGYLDIAFRVLVEHTTFYEQVQQAKNATAEAWHALSAIEDQLITAAIDVREWTR